MDRAGFRRELTASEKAWLRCFAEAGDAGRAAVAPLAGTEDGRAVLGRGGGGDATLLIDERAEGAILSVLRNGAPGPFAVVSEEAGIVPVPGDGAQDHAAGPGAPRATAGGPGALVPPLVLVDPVDGSLNAKRGLPTHCAAFALADGPRLGDVVVGFAADYNRPLRYAAVRGAGLVVESAGAGVAFGEGGAAGAGSAGVRAAVEGRSDALVEVLLVEAGRPHGHDFRFRDLATLAGADAGPEMRVRIIGSLALCLCHLAEGVADVLYSPVHCRAVDIAGGLLMVLETGGGAMALDDSDLRAQPLDLERRAPFVAWRAGVDGERVGAAARRLWAGR